MNKNELHILLSAGISPRSLTKAEVLNSFPPRLQDYFLVVPSHLRVPAAGLWFEVKDVDPSEHTYILVPDPGLTLKEMLRDGQGLPKAGLLVGDPVPDHCGGQPCP